MPNPIWRSLTAKSERSTIGTAKAIWRTLSAKSSAGLDSVQMTPVTHHTCVTTWETAHPRNHPPSANSACSHIYGQELLKALSARLTAEFGQGFSVSNLQLMRKFFIEYKFRIQQQAAVKLRSIEFKHEHLGHATKTEEN